MAWAEDQAVRGAETAVADLNARGGAPGEQMEIVRADDYCEGPQAVAAANKPVAVGVVAAFGHQCPQPPFRHRRSMRTRALS